MKRFFARHFYFVRNWWHTFLVIKNKIYFRTHKSLKKWFIQKYKKNFKRKPNFDNPSLFSEKLYVQMMKFNHPNGPILVDKIAVKDYLIKQGYSEFVTPTLACFKSQNDLDFAQLPNEFVVKCNHDSGSTYLVNKELNQIKDRDGRSYSFKKMKKFLGKSLRTSMYFQGFEKQYKDVVPQILVEEMIKTENGEFLSDYKIFCNYGKPVFVYIVVGRSNKGEKTIFLDSSLNLIYTNSLEFKNDYKRFIPQDIKKMLDFASKISKEFKIARVDLYYTKSLGIRFGEIAFSHYGGTNTGASYPDYDADMKIGGMFN